MSTDRQGVPHERSKKLQDFKKEHSLPSWKEIQEKERLGLVEEAERRIAQMARFTELNNQLVQTAHAAGWGVTNVLHQIIDLQNKLWDLEERLKANGKNPLEDAAYLKARQQLATEMQFIHKHKLDVDKFQSEKIRKADVLGDDDLFKVE